jgi:hypothetical protein
VVGYCYTFLPLYSRGKSSLYSTAGTKVMPHFFLNGAPGKVSCLTHRIATLYSSTSLVGAPVSHVHSIVSVQNGGCYGLRTRQRVVNEFLTAEGCSPIEIYRRLRSVYSYSEDAVDVSSVKRWIHRFKSGEKDQPRQRRRRPKLRLMP